MIITRSPLRISLGGGGHRSAFVLPRTHRLVVSAAIDKYVYITLHETFDQELIMKYSKMELVRSGGRGEASDRSGSPATGPDRHSAPRNHEHGGHPRGYRAWLFRQLHDRAAAGTAHLPEERRSAAVSSPSRPAISRSTCWANRSESRISTSPRLAGSPASSFCPMAGSRSPRCNCTPETLYNLEDNLLLFFTGFTRSASAILREQDQRTRAATAR